MAESVAEPWSSPRPSALSCWSPDPVPICRLCSTPSPTRGPHAYGAEIVAVGADRDGIEGLARAERAGLPTFVCRVKDYATREEWDAALAEAVAAYEPDLVVSAGFMKIVGKEFLARFGGRFVNTHPALLPSFPGAHGVRDALAYGAKVTGCTVHFVDDGVDTGPIIAQGVVEVRDEDYEDEEPLCTSASRKSSEGCSSMSWGGSPATAIALRDER